MSKEQTKYRSSSNIYIGVSNGPPASDTIELLPDVKPPKPEEVIDLIK